MSQEGKYLYCIIGANEGRNFGPIGIGNRDDVVSTIGYRDLSGVISNSPMAKYVISRENLMAHEKVIEKVMQDYTVLPVRFCTIATSAEEITDVSGRGVGLDVVRNSVKRLGGTVEVVTQKGKGTRKARPSQILELQPST